MTGILAAGQFTNPFANMSLQNLQSFLTLVPLVVSVGGIYLLCKGGSAGKVVGGVLMGLLLATTTVGSSITSYFPQISHGIL